jgi:prophage regulatory protein
MQILRISEVARVTGLSTSSIYKQIRIGKFPRGVKLTARSTGWSSEDVDNWIASRLSASEPRETAETCHD